MQPGNGCLALEIARNWMERALHRYRPLQENDTIRILELDPGQHDDPLTGSLETVPVDSAGKYEAVSYVWAEPGPPDTSYEILLRDGDGNEGLLELKGGAVFAVLRHLRLPDRPRRIWADQCCINQGDRVERGQQVQFMNKIYRDAVHVLVWLGLDTKNEAAAAFNLVYELDKALGGSKVGGASRQPDTAVLERHVRENQKALQALTDRPWFKRGWIVQEIGTSTPATMIWGNASIDWDTLASVCERLKSYQLLRKTLGITTSDISFLYRRFIEPDERTHHANRFNLVYELQRSRHLRFSDDRDRVFAFLGHFSVLSSHPLGCGPVSIAADYTKTVEQTYVDVAVQIVRTQPAASCIVLAAVQHPCHSLPSSRRSSNSSTATPGDGTDLETWLQDDLKLPSWVPDWRWSEGILLAEPICPHRTHGDSTAQLEIVEEDHHPVLKIHGVEMDHVEASSRPLLSEDFYRKKSPGQPWTMIERLWREICGKKSFNLDDRYIDSEAAFFAFMQTLSNGCVQAAGHECRPYHEIPDRVWLQTAARYIVESFGVSGEVSEGIRSMARGSQRERDRDQWSRWAVSAAEGRIFARTKKGYYVLGPAAIEEGDVVCVLFGSKVPFCLRPVGGHRYLLVGECYVHGLMKGEAMKMLDRDELDESVFDIV